MDDLQYMERAIALAARAVGHTHPNPMVGCVIVRDGQIVGEGWHRGPGTPHAEVDALAAAADAAKGATAYVTLEPCNHHGNTPPCTEALIRAGIAEVVYAASDPNPLAAGGAARLQEAGISVRGGVAEAGARDLIAPWLFSINADRPYTYAKLAMTLDGRTATRNGESKWITGPAARARGHLFRQRTDAIVVGIGTVLADDPSLDPRPVDADPAPSTKVVLDTALRTSDAARLFASEGQVIIACGSDASEARRSRLCALGAGIIEMNGETPAARYVDVLRQLKLRGIQSVLVEGGAQLLGSAFDSGTVDEVLAFIAPSLLGGGQPAIEGQGPEHLADLHKLQVVEQEWLGPDLFIRGKIERRKEAV